VEPLLALIALLLQAVFLGSETSLVRANWIRVSNWAGENRLWAGRARDLLDQKEPSLITTFVGASVFMVILSSLSERFFVHAVGRGGTFVSVFAVSVISLLFAQYLPKAVAQTFPERWLASFAPLLQLARGGFWPLTWLLGRIAGVEPSRKTAFTVTRRDVLFALRESARSDITRSSSSHRSSLSARPSSLLRGIAARLLDFPELPVAEVMTPNDRVVAVPEDISQQDLEQVIREHSYTRLPVYRQRRDEVVGVIHVRDLLRKFGDSHGFRRLTVPNFPVRPPFFVAEKARAIEVMNRMKDQGEHIAIVQDQDHHAVGIVTLEDLLEELVGEIRSEE